MPGYNGQQVLLIPEGAQRSTGRDASRLNIIAARSVAEVVRSTLGPMGMDKMLVDTVGDVVVTNDGVTILDKMDIQHPTAKLMVEVAKAQQEEIGDGTTTAVIIAGELLKRAGELVDSRIHPTVIVKGYRMASLRSREVLREISRPVDAADGKTLRSIAVTAMTSKGVEGAREHLADIAAEAVRLVAERDGPRFAVDKDCIKVERKEGGSILDSELVRGVALDKSRVHSGMPRRVAKARIALVSRAFEAKGTETKAEIRITEPGQLEGFLRKEEDIVRQMVAAVKGSGANALFCQKGIDDLAQHYLAKAGVLAVQQVKESDMTCLARASGARIVNEPRELSPKDVGWAGLVEETDVAGSDMVFVRDCKNPKAVTIVVRGGTKHVAEEAEKAVQDAVDDVSVAVRDGRIVVGAGSAEVEVARRLREYADTVGGREQLAIDAFADALEACPRALAENAGRDPTDLLVAMRQAHARKGGASFGLDVFSGEVVDMSRRGVLEPLALKVSAVKTASEVAEMILRIDDIVVAKELGKGDEGAAGPPCGPSCGMGGMPGMM